ncbi:hypothetical protein KI387_013650, partial [Taxus chinensis]
MDVLNIDWKNIDSRFERDDFYEDIRAPKWLDFLALEEPVDDDAWFCKPDCNHPRTAASLLDAPLIESLAVKELRPVRPTSTVSVSSTMPLGDRTARTLNHKKTGGPLSASATSLYELKAKENASRNLKKPSPADRNKHESRTGKYRLDAENDNPNRPCSISAASSMGKIAPSSVGKSPKVESMKNAATGHAKVSKQCIAAKDSQSPLSIEKKGVAKQQEICNLSASSTTTPVSATVSNEKKGARKQIVHNTTTTPVKTPESGEKKGPRKQLIYSSTPTTTPTQTTKITPNKTPTIDNKSPSPKSGSAFKATFSAGNIFGKPPRKDFMTHLSEFCSEVKKLALYGSQKDSTKVSNMTFKHGSNAGNEEKGKQARDDKISCLSEFFYERPSLSGFKDHNVLRSHVIDDPDKCSKSGPIEIGGLRQRNSKKATAKSCPKPGDERNRTSHAEKKGDLSSKQQKVDGEDFPVLAEIMVRDSLTNLSALHEHAHDNLKKVENREDSSRPSLESFSGPIHSLEHKNTVRPVDPQLQESSDHQENALMEPHKKSLHAKIFNPSSWKKKRNDGMDRRVHSTKKDSWKTGQKVQSCPPSPQQVSRLSQSSSSSSQGRKSTTTPMQPFRFRTSERGTLKEYKKLQRSSSCAENVAASPEPRLYIPDVFWFLKHCA